VMTPAWALQNQQDTTTGAQAGGQTQMDQREYQADQQARQPQPGVSDPAPTGEQGHTPDEDDQPVAGADGDIDDEDTARVETYQQEERTETRVETDDDRAAVGTFDDDEDEAAAGTLEQDEDRAAVGTVEQDRAAVGTVERDEDRAAAGTFQQEEQRDEAFQRDQDQEGRLTQDDLAQMDPPVGEDTIRALQQALNEEGHDIMVDGIWGPQTQQALTEFQQDKGLSASGQLDPETLAELNLEQHADVAQADADDDEDSALFDDEDDDEDTGLFQDDDD
jgi:hypothetical protein